MKGSSDDWLPPRPTAWSGGGGDGRSSERVELRRRTWTYVRGTPSFQRLRLASGIAITLAVALPTFVLPPIESRLVTQLVATSVILWGLQFLVGQCGQLSLGHGTFAGVGAYTTAILVARHGWPHVAALLAAAVAGLLAGFLVGLPALRIRGSYLALVTFSLAVSFPMLVRRFAWLTSGSSGLANRRELRTPAWTGLDPEQPQRWVHLVVVACAVVMYLVARNLSGSAVGRAVRATAQNPTSATSCGVHIHRTRLAAFGVAASFAAVGGGLLVFETPVVGADTYEVFRSLGFYSAVVVGGLGYLLGGVIGAAMLVSLPYLIIQWDLGLSAGLVYGSLLLVATFFFPGGLAGAVWGWLRGQVEVLEPQEAAWRAEQAPARVGPLDDDPGEPLRLLADEEWIDADRAGDGWAEADRRTGR